MGWAWRTGPYDSEADPPNAGTALIADLRLDPRKPYQSGDPVRTNTITLFNQVIIQLAIAVNLAAFGPGLLQQFSPATGFDDIAEFLCQFQHAQATLRNLRVSIPLLRPRRRRSSSHDRVLLFKNSTERRLS